jgi:hypothetical protein
MQYSYILGKDAWVIVQLFYSRHSSRSTCHPFPNPSPSTRSSAPIRCCLRSESPPRPCPLFAAAAVRGRHGHLLVAAVASVVRARHFPESLKPSFLAASAFRGRQVRQQPCGGAVGPRIACCSWPPRSFPHGRRRRLRRFQPPRPFPGIPAAVVPGCRRRP